jgi:YVTN family beta-propeller protein
MYSNNSKGSRAAWARGFVALVAIMLAMGLALAASPAEAAPFAYITNERGGTVSVIDTATTPPSVVGAVRVGSNPLGVGVTPDGKHVYVANGGSQNVSVIDTTTNTVVTGTGFPIPVQPFPLALAVNPDGKHVYVANYSYFAANPVWVIDRTTNPNTVVATPGTAGSAPLALAVNPDGKHVYVANSGSNNVSVIDTTSNTVVATVPVLGPNGVAVTPNGKYVYVTKSGTVSVIDMATTPPSVVGAVRVGSNPYGVGVTPDGKHVYVANDDVPGTVSVIDTTSNTVVATVPVGSSPVEVAITPDGKHVYAGGYNNVSVIDTTSNTVVATVPLAGVSGIGIVPPPPGVPFLAFGATLAIDFDGAPTFNLYSNFTLSSTASIHPLTEPVTLQVGTFTTTIPPGSFTQNKAGPFTFAGVISGVNLNALIKLTGTLRYAFQASATGASLTGTTNPIYVTLIIGGDSGATSVKAKVSP